MARKKKQITKTVSKKELTPEEVLKAAKKLGLFKLNRYFSRYEITLSINDYEKL